MRAGAAPKKAQDRAVTDLRTVADRLEVTTLTGRAYNAAREDGMLPATTVRDRFGTWAAACEAAGLTPADQAPPKATTQNVIAGLKEVAANLDVTVLTKTDYDQARDPGRQMSSAQVARRFTSWAEACRAAGLASGLARGRQGRRPTRGDERILRDLRQVADALGVATLTRGVYDEARAPGRHFSSGRLTIRFGTWAAACEAAGLSSGKSRRRTFGA